MSQNPYIAAEGSADYVESNENAGSISEPDSVYNAPATDTVGVESTSATPAVKVRKYTPRKADGTPGKIFTCVARKIKGGGVAVSIPYNDASGARQKYEGYLAFDESGKIVVTDNPPVVTPDAPAAN